MGVAVEAVIWDFGGVLTSSPFEAFNRFEAERGLPKDLIRTINATNPHDNAWARFERAEIDRAAFDLQFREESAAFGQSVGGGEVLALIGGDLRPRMVAALQLCKQSFKVGCITNNMNHGEGPGMVATSDGASRIGGVLALFDAVIESSKAGVRKPDPRIYLMMCELLAVQPASCVYLDDLGVNCKPAAELGMKAIKVLNQDQALADLAQATTLTFADSASPAA